MIMTQEVQISSDKSTVWQAITDIENCQQMISSIVNLKVIDKPDSGIVGLKWQETRVMFGKEADETMWITEAVDTDYYATRAESHGAVYISKLSLQETASGVLLTMSFTAHPQTVMAKVMSFLMTPLIKGTMKKAVMKDLSDIKAFVERQ